MYVSFEKNITWDKTKVEYFKLRLRFPYMIYFKAHSTMYIRYFTKIVEFTHSTIFYSQMYR